MGKSVYIAKQIWFLCFTDTAKLLAEFVRRPLPEIL